MSEYDWLAVNSKAIKDIQDVIIKLIDFLSDLTNTSKILTSKILDLEKRIEELERKDAESTTRS